MSTLLKYKKVIIAVLITLAVITSIVAFSVSYAKWTSPSSTITANGTIGSWSTGPNAIVLDNGAEYSLNESNGVFSTTFTVEDGKSKKFNVVDKANNSLTYEIGAAASIKDKDINGCAVETTDERYGYVTTGYTSKSGTTYFDGTYWAFIEGEKIAFSFILDSSIDLGDDGGDFSSGFDAIIASPNTMRSFLGGDYLYNNRTTQGYGIITSNGDRIHIYNEKKDLSKIKENRSDLFTLAVGDQFAALIDGRVQGGNGIKVPAGIDAPPSSGSIETCKFIANKAGTYYISSYSDNKNVTFAKVGSLDFTSPVEETINFIQIKGHDSFFAAFEITDGGSKEFALNFNYKELGSVTLGEGVTANGTCYTATGNGIYTAVVDDNGNVTIGRVSELAKITFNTTEIIIGNRYKKDIDIVKGERFTVSLCGITITPDIAAVIAKDITLDGNICTAQTDGKYSFIIEISVNGIALRIRQVEAGEQPPAEEVRKLVIGDTTVDLAKGNAKFTVENGSAKSFKVYFGETEVTTVTEGADYVTYNAATGFTASANGDYTVSLDTDGKLTVEFKALVTPDTITFEKATAGTLSANQTVDGSWTNLSKVEILANATKTVTVDNTTGGTTADGLAYKGYLGTGGVGTSTERCISLTLKEGYDYKITVYARSTGDVAEERKVQCIGATTETAAEAVDVKTGAINGFVFNVNDATGGATCQIASTNKGINIYLIVIEPIV